MNFGKGIYRGKTSGRLQPSGGNDVATVELSSRPSAGSSTEQDKILYKASFGPLSSSLVQALPFQAMTFALSGWRRGRRRTAPCAPDDVQIVLYGSRL